MSLDLINNLINGLKENDFVQNFINELTDAFKNNDLSNNTKDNILKQEDVLYQVVDIFSNGAYLQNTETNKVAKETDIPKDVLDKIKNDSILRFKDGQYIYEKELTR